MTVFLRWGMTVQIEDDDRIDEGAGDGAGIDRSTGISLWHQIHETLRQEIASGAWQPGDKLPTEQALAGRFGVNRHTVRRAVGALAQNGLVRVEQGRGTFVQEGVIDYRVGLRTRFSENILRNQREPRGRLVRSTITKASSKVAHALGLPSGTDVVLLEKVGDAGGSPLSFGTSYFPAERFPGLEAALAESASVTAALAKFGIGDYRRLSTRVTARMPTAEEARHLRQPVTRPILQSEAINVDPAGRPIEFGLTRFAADRVQIVFEMPIVDDSSGDSFCYDRK